MFLIEIIKAICKCIINVLRVKLSDKTAQMEYRRFKKPAKDADFATWLEYYMKKAKPS